MASDQERAVSAATTSATAGSVGGASNESGGFLRARVGALLALGIMEGTPISRAGLELPGVRGTAISAETDDPVDDLVVDLASGGRVFIQVKLRAGLGSTTGSATDKAVRQFSKAVQAGLGPADSLVLATAMPVAELRALGEFLDRARLSHSGAPTEQEISGRYKLASIASRYLSDEQVQVLFEHLLIWQTDPTRGDGATALNSGLAATFVEPEHAIAATSALTDAIRTIARKRGGLDGLALVESLRERVPLKQTTDPQSRVAQVNALAKHREREQRYGSTLRLFGAPLALADLPLAKVDAQTYVLYGDARTGDPLERILRRLGRMLLIGEPGGGKSTALAAMSAHWAARTAWPVPIRAHLKRLATAKHGIGDSILDGATEDVLGNERDALRTVLAHKINSGESLLVLDGVDEIGDSRLPVLDELHAWLSNLPEGNGVLIATRPSTAPDAQVLGLPSATLLAPDHPRHTADVVVETAAPSDPAIREEWIKSRHDWLSQAFDRDQSLERTPLMVVTLALIAVMSATSEDLPHGRAQILKRSLFDAVRRWDVEQRARGNPRLGPLEGSQAREAITDVLIHLCKVCVESSDTPEPEVRQQIASMFVDDFGARSGQARSGARDAVQFWLDSALFYFDGGSLTARPRPLAEAGVAVSIQDAEIDDIDTWVDWARADPARGEVLALAAGLSQDVLQAWIRRFGRDGTAAELIGLADAFSDGVSVAPEELEVVLSRALALRAEKDEVERVTEAIIELPLPAATRESLRASLLQHVPVDQRLLIDALIVTRWEERGPDADKTLRTLISDVVPDGDEPSRGEDGILRLESSYVDGPYRDVYESAARRLVTLGRADAELVVAHKFAGSLEHHRAVLAALNCAGHKDLAAEFEASWSRAFESYRTFVNRDDLYHETLRALTQIRSLAAPARLLPDQAHRMDELASLFETAGVGHGPIGRNLPPDEQLRAWLGGVADLAGLNRAVLAAQASQLESEILDEVEDILFAYELGEDRSLSNWDRVEEVDSAIEALVANLGRIHDRNGRVQYALHVSPARASAVPLLQERLRRARNGLAETIAWTIILCSPDPNDLATTYAASHDPMMRTAAAHWASLQVAMKQASAAKLGNFLADNDENVRTAALAFLKRDELDGATRDWLRKVEDGVRVDWQCRWCGAINKAVRRSCHNCDTSGPDAPARARELLTTPGTSNLLELMSARAEQRSVRRGKRRPRRG